MSNLLLIDNKPDWGVRRGKSHPPSFFLKDLLMRFIVIISIIIGIIVSTSNGADIPESVKRKACNGKYSCWQLNNENTYIVADCEGNIWWLRTYNTSDNAAIIKEEILYNAKDICTAQQIIKDTLEQHNLKSKQWFD